MPKQASDITPGDYTSFLFKGSAGFGKTLAAATFALAGPIYIAYFDKKNPIELTRFFSRFGETGKKILANISYDLYSSANPHEYLNHLMSLRTNNPYFAHVTDSVTTLTAAAVNWSQLFSSNGTSPVDSDPDKIIPGFDEYKVETSFVSKAIDACRLLNSHIIWIAHPLPSLKIEEAGATIRVTKTNPIVTYGSKVAGMIPPSFTEIYHFTQKQEWNPGQGNSSKRFIVALESLGDEFAKSPMLEGTGISELDITNRFFYEVWKKKVDEVHAHDKAKLDSTKDKPLEIPQLKKW